MCIELWCCCALPSVAPVNQNEKNGPRFCLVFMCCCGPPGWCIRSSAPSWDPSKTCLRTRRLTQGRESLMQACVTLTWCNAIYPSSVYVPSLLLLICISASPALNDCSSQWTHRDLCLYEKLHYFQWLTLKPCMQVLRFHPTVWDHKLNNLAGAASEGIYKQRVSIYTGLLKLQCGK